LKIVIRADASLHIGTGHLIRCRTLAGELRQRGADVQFICRDPSGPAAAALAPAGFRVLALTSWGGGGARVGAGRLGAPQAQDAEEARRALDGTRADCLIVDHYALDAEWEQAMRPYAGRIMAIDDLADRSHDCDILLDQNYGSDAPGRYEALVPPMCRLLLGPRYALLQPEYRRHIPRLRGKVERVLVSFGGSDGNNATGLALEALSAPELSHLHVDVVVGTANPNRSALEAQAGRRGRAEIHGPQPHLADLMERADLAIGAGGSTTWERLCLGLPALVVAIADNQVPASQALAAAGLIDYAGPHESLTAGSLKEKIAQLLNDEERLLALSRGGPVAVDGWGVLRTVEVLIPTAMSELRLRPARRTDAAVYFGWANETEVRRQSLNTAPVPWDVHIEWFNDKLASCLSHLFVLEAHGGLPVGQIRFDLAGDGTARLSYMLDPVVRGRDWASNLVAQGLSQLRSLGPLEIYAEVRTSNLSSRAAFERLGFSHEDMAERGIRIYRQCSADPRPSLHDGSSHP